jgi:hypothetical protein
MQEIQEIIIDQEFKLLLPALDEITYAWLEENILEHGCMQPLVLWNGILIDGHNRYEIVQKHNIPFNTVNMEFDSRDNVLIWIISTQISRRNLTPIQLSFFRGLHYNTDKKSRGDSDRFTQQGAKVHNEPLQESTANRLAEQYNVSRSTIKRDAQLAKAISAIGRASPEAKKDILAERTRISRKKLRELLAGPEEDITDVAVRIESGTFEKEKIAAQTRVEQGNPIDLILAGIRTLNAAISKISDNFSGDKSELKTELRSHIDMLEDLYNRI